MMFSGTYTALVTPFRKGRVDDAALDALIREQIRGGVDGVVPVGTTGESPTLDHQEHIRVVELAVKSAKGKAPVIAGAGANSTQEAIDLSRRSEAAGANGLLHVAPYYNRPSQAGLFQHFRAIARSTGLPIILYSIPSRCGVEIGVDTAARLRDACANIVGIKEAGGRSDRVSQLRSALGPEFTILSGDDALTLPFIAVGANGLISVASNILPKPVSRMTRACLKGDFQAARTLHFKYYPLFRDLFLETNPVPVKTALAMMGRVHEEFRPPLSKLSAANRKRLAHSLAAAGLLKTP